jgi:hypothetical protein
MKNIIIALFIFSSFSLYSQNEDVIYNEYSFKIENITDPDDAKAIKIQLRKLTSEIIFYFDNDLDVFTLKTTNIYEPGEFVAILVENNYQATVVE